MFFWLIVVLAFAVEIDPPQWWWVKHLPPPGPRPEFVSAVKDQQRKRFEDQREHNPSGLIDWSQVKPR